MNRFIMRNIFLTIIATLLSMGVAFGQFLETNNFGIFPAGGTNPTTNFDVKFTSLGESCGVPGPTPQGCDLYGFRAQINTTNSINLGMNAVGFGSLTIPTLTFENGAQQGALDRFWTTNQTGSGCGTLLSFYGQNSGNIVFTLLGSGLASGGTWQPSDRNLKDNIKPIGNALQIVQQLDGVTYNYRTEEFPVLNLNEGLNYGFIAQDVEKVMPSAVRGYFDEYGEKTDIKVMQYDAIIPVLTEAIKEQQDVISDLEERITRLEALLNQGEVEPKLSPSLEGLELGQNRPNPADQTTLIDFRLPSRIGNASLVVYDLYGKKVADFPISTSMNKVKINTAEWASGTYVYAIMKEGQNLLRRKMVIR